MPETALLAQLAPPTTAAIAANVAFTAARAAGRAHELAGGAGGFDAGYAAERAWQLGWLRDRLGIADRDRRRAARPSRSRTCPCG